MADKKTFINKTGNPVKMRNAAGEVELVPVGEPIEVDENGAKLALKLGMVDFSKMAKPSVAVAELQKEILDLKAKLAELRKENADLKAKLAAADKEIASLKEDLEIAKV